VVGRGPLVGACVDEAVAAHELVGERRAARAVLVGRGRLAPALQLVQQRREDAPGVRQLVRAHKVDLRAAEHLQNQPLVRLGQVQVLRFGPV